MPYYMYITVQGEDKIARFTMDASTGTLTSLADVAVVGGPAPLAIDPKRQFLHVGQRGVCEISSYRIDQRSGDLSLLGAVSLNAEPCYLAMDRKGQFLFSAYYQAGKAAVHPIGPDGAVGSPPIVWRDTARGAHCFQTDPSNRFAFVPHIAGNGPNAIFQFMFDDQTGQITPNTPAMVSPENADGPRHFCFHPSKDILYFSNEQGCSVTAYYFDTAAGTLHPFQTVSTLPEDNNGQNTCAQIQITPNGRFLYAPNRGHNSIACFAIDKASGTLTLTGRVLTEPIPRAFSVDPMGQFLFAAGLESGRLAAYRIDSSTGTLTHMETYPIGSRPMWVLIIQLPA